MRGLRQKIPWGWSDNDEDQEQQRFPARSAIAVLSVAEQGRLRALAILPAPITMIRSILVQSSSLNKLTQHIRTGGHYSLWLVVRNVLALQEYASTLGKKRSDL